MSWKKTSGSGHLTGEGNRSDNEYLQNIEVIRSISNQFFLLQKHCHPSIIDAFCNCSPHENQDYHQAQSQSYTSTWRPPSEQVSVVNLVVAIHHFQHATPALSQVLQLATLYVSFKIVLQKNTMVELDVQVDCLLP